MKSDSYYGGFYWIAITSFVVPLFVAYAAFNKLTPTTKPTPTPDASGVDNDLWDYLLRKYVDNGLVDYQGMAKDYLFTTYLRQLAGADPTKLTTPDEQLALHCNAYNALVINGVIKHKIHLNERNVLEYAPKDVAAKVEEIDREIEMLKRTPNADPLAIAQLMKKADDLRTQTQFFKIHEHHFANKTISLDQLEHEMIRPVFKEPRIHVALVCAAKSCPAIRGEAYVGDRLELQLEDQTRQFANSSTYVDYDTVADLVRLSPIVNWYSEDWDAVGGYLKWLSERVSSDTMREKLLAADSQDVKVVFNSYDWTLNSQSGGGATNASKSGGFGSGSVPNE